MADEFGFCAAEFIWGAVQKEAAYDHGGVIVMEARCCELTCMLIPLVYSLSLSIFHSSLSPFSSISLVWVLVFCWSVLAVPATLASVIQVINQNSR